MKHRAFYGCSEPRMNLVDSGSFDDLSDVVDSDSSTSHDGDPSACCSYQPTDRFHALHTLLLSTRCENPVCSRRANILERFEKISRNIKCSMECNREGLRLRDQLPGSLHVHSRIMIQNAKHDTIGAFAFGQLDIPLHDVEFDVGVTEITGTRPNDHVQTQ